MAPTSHGLTTGGAFTRMRRRHELLSAAAARGTLSQSRDAQARPSDALIENEKKASTLPSASGRIASDSAKVETAPAAASVPEAETASRATRPQGSMPG